MFKNVIIVGSCLSAVLCNWKTFVLMSYYKMLKRSWLEEADRFVLFLLVFKQTSANLGPQQLELLVTFEKAKLVPWLLRDLGCACSKCGKIALISKEQTLGPFVGIAWNAYITCAKNPNNSKLHFLFRQLNSRSFLKSIVPRAGRGSVGRWKLKPTFF